MLPWRFQRPHGGVVRLAGQPLVRWCSRRENFRNGENGSNNRAEDLSDSTTAGSEMEVVPRTETAHVEAKAMAHWCEALAFARPSPFSPYTCERQPRGQRQRSFFRRPLSEGLIAFSTAEGRRLLKESILDDGSSSSFVEIMTQFDTQSNPLSCGLASLAMAFNILGKRLPSDSAITHQSSVSACDHPTPLPHHAGFVTEGGILHSLVEEGLRERIRCGGVSLAELAEMASRMEGLRIRVVHGGAPRTAAASEEPLRELLEASTRWGLPRKALPPTVLILNFSRSGSPPRTASAPHPA